jgi:hypothetical protein
MKPSKELVLTTSTLLGGLVGSYLVHGQGLSFWHEQAAGGLGALTGRLIAMAITNPKTWN